MYSAALLKTSQGIKQAYHNTSPLARRRATYVILLIIAVLMFRKSFSNFFGSLFNRDINKLDVDKTNLTYTTSEFHLMCSTLDASMSGSGTDEQTIYATMRKMKNQDDWQFLQKTFGVRKKDGGFWSSDISGDLKKWLSDDLYDSEVDEVRSILSESNISY
jgi:hypothetical protein